MDLISRGARAMVLLIGVVIAGLGLAVAPAQAAMVPTEAVIDDETRAQERARLGAFLEREDVREQLEALGVAPEEARARAQSLSDEEIALLADNLNALPAGEGPLETVLVVLLILLLILILI